MRTMTWLGALLLLSCGTQEGVGGAPVCDGQKQDQEDSVDAPFDEDGDGFVDGDNTSCQRAYEDWELDCDDSNPDVHPDAEEIECNDVDDDCSGATLDAPDADFDGTGSCEGDCDDSDPERSPEFVDVCHDEIDQDCDGEADDGCPPLYTGTWELVGDPLSYSCLVGQIKVEMSGVEITDENPDITFDTLTARPGVLSGDLVDDKDVDVWYVLQGDCNEGYRIQGTFVDEDTFEGTIVLDFQGVCLSCADQQAEITLERVIEEE